MNVERGTLYLNIKLAVPNGPNAPSDASYEVIRRGGWHERVVELSKIKCTKEQAKEIVTGWRERNELIGAGVLDAHWVGPEKL